MLAFVMAAEKPPFKRSLTPRVGGVEIPPLKRQPSRVDVESVVPSSMPPEDRESVLGWLQHQRERQDTQHAEVMHEVRETRRDVDSLERRVSLVERGVLRIETLDAKFDALNERLWQGQQRDFVTADKLGAIELRMKKTAEDAGDVSGGDSGRDAARKLVAKYGPAGAVVVLVLSYADKWGPALWKLLNQ